MHHGEFLLKSFSKCLLLAFFAGVAKFRGRSAANGGRGFSAACSKKQRVASVGQPGNWRSASTGQFDVMFFFISNPHFTNVF